ncbi:MAG: carboxymuconolactone decarboxylase family protein [Desulfobaccales bacterium]
MARLPDPTASLSPQGRALYAQLAAKRGRIDGMYRSLLNHPELTQHVSDLGTFLRFGSGALPDALRELLILWVARELGAAYEWVKHEPVARKFGVSAAVIEAIRTRHEPQGLEDLQQATLTAARCVLSRRSIPQIVQDELTAALGLPGVVELVVLCGFYEMIAAVIFAFDVPLPEGAPDPFGSNGTAP